MTTYLTGGWYGPGPKGGLRTEVLDGAMDAAGMLHRAGISPELVSTLALRVRGLVRLGDGLSFGPDEREIVARRLEPLTGHSPELLSFVADCLDHVSGPADLTAFYLHLVHITRMMQLLRLAQIGPAPEPAAGAPPRRARVTRKRAKRPAARKAGSGARKKSGRGAAPSRRTPKAAAAKRKTRPVRRATTKRRR